jgi:multimeric flavodoxin WrbA
MIAKQIDAEVYRIRAASPYPHSYAATVARNVREQNADARPRIPNRLKSIDAYDVVLLGSPIWNVRPPMIMSTFAERSPGRAAASGWQRRGSSRGPAPALS